MSHSFIRSFSKFLFLLFGGGVVLLSLLSANRVFSQEESLELTRQKLYFQRDILPDHLLYPVIMVFDRVKLDLAEENRAIELRIAYAWRRLGYTAALLERGYQALSFSTLTKAYKYYNAALLQAQTASLSLAQQQRLVLDSDQFLLETAAVTTSFTDAQQQELKRLSDQQIILKQFFIDSF